MNANQKYVDDLFNLWVFACEPVNSQQDFYFMPVKSYLEKNFDSLLQVMPLFPCHIPANEVRYHTTVQVFALLLLYLILEKFCVISLSTASAICCWNDNKASWVEFCLVYFWSHCVSCPTWQRPYYQLE